jgi:hypothetical protein
VFHPRGGLLRVVLERTRGRRFLLRRKLRIGWLVPAALLAVGCGGSGSSADAGGDTPGDAEDAVGDGDDVLPDGDDVLPDGDDVTDGELPDGTTARGTAVLLTAGGGTAQSMNYRLTLSVGTPQPMGSAASGSTEARLGPGAVQNQ